MTKQISRFVYWTPRVLSIVFLLFLASLSLDVISSELRIEQVIIGLLMHNIPTLVLLIVLIISWKYEIVGGIAFLIAGLLYIILVSRANITWPIALSWSLIVAGPAFIVGIFFMINWFKKK